MQEGWISQGDKVKKWLVFFSFLEKKSLTFFADMFDIYVRIHIYLFGKRKDVSLSLSLSRRDFETYKRN